MVKEFEMRKSADAYARIATAKTGVINTNKLPQYKFTEDIFKKVTVIPKGKNHGFVMFLDWSGSMSPNLDYTMKQLFSLTMFCKRVNIPFEVYLFRTHYQDYASPQQVIGDNTTVDFMGAFKIRNILSSRMNVGTLQKAYELLWIAANRQRFRCDRMESTPLNQTILAADKIVNDFRNKNKLQVVNTIFLTDGCSDPCVYKNSVPSPKKNGNKYIIRDEVTKKTYWLNDIYYGMTSTFLRILKDRTGCNLVGFYLYQGSQLGHLVSSGIIDDSVVNNEETRKCWKDNQFAAVESAGYDEYYIVRVVRQRVIDDLVVNSNMTKNQITKTFMKFSDRKSINRIMLTKFITRVANASY
jgi:hypothetical protein